MSTRVKVELVASISSVRTMLFGNDEQARFHQLYCNDVSCVVAKLPRVGRDSLTQYTPLRRQYNYCFGLLALRTTRLITWLTADQNGHGAMAKCRYSLCDLLYPLIIREGVQCSYTLCRKWHSRYGCQTAYGCVPHMFKVSSKV